ncbi:uncharacterized protein LOC123217303 isoform X1 [Mangifera indica]|uniref:uncharacterized protein LOC123217303 isoform X1 n=1 Tax=Mangifera indica TaxID=29780 RepID=UPI001CFB8456|nr:uncharacterized protein LOC123217303 isoform X1 [Mangifera indica]XP_044494180.1 uncharacterized protein LOC123217303 isoform X1 [Mangifera indica]
MRAYAKNETSHSTSIKSPGETLENFTQVLLPSSGDYSEIEREKPVNSKCNCTSWVIALSFILVQICWGYNPNNWSKPSERSERRRRRRRSWSISDNRNINSEIHNNATTGDWCGKSCKTFWVLLRSWSRLARVNVQW